MEIHSKYYPPTLIAYKKMCNIANLFGTNTRKFDATKT